MPSVSNSKVVQHPAEDIYRKVIDIESYPRLLTFIQDTRILERSGSQMTARVSVGAGLLAFSYDCRIEFKQPEYVKVELISGPFKKLKACWKFEPLDAKSCRVHYSLDSQFKNPIMEMTAGAIFASQLDQSIKAFEGALKRS